MIGRITGDAADRFREKPLWIVAGSRG